MPPKAILSSAKVLFLSIVILVSNIVVAQDLEDSELEELVVSGVRAGGAQDISYARSEVLSGRIPHPDTFTAEGLLNQYDLALAPPKFCKKLFCIFGEVVESNLVSKPTDEYLAGLSFATNLEGHKWQRPPTNIIAVVDKSGSMGGRPLDLVRSSLLSLLKELRPQDSLAIVLYGDRAYVHLKPMELGGGNKKVVRESIKAIQSQGSTNMESGLKIAYRLATDIKQESGKQTRVILFTDERPNVGTTDAGSFVAMAADASKKGIGLTTIGVGVQFDATLANKIGSARGGNLFYVSDEKTSKTVFSEELDFMLSELAHDLIFSVKPNPKLRITGVYGVPGDTLTWGDDGAVEFTVPTVFLSTRGGGIYVTLAKNLSSDNLPTPRFESGDTIIGVDIAYTPASGERETDEYQVSKLGSQSPAVLELTSLLLDQYIGLKAATTEHYIHNDHEKAYQVIDRLNNRLKNIDDQTLSSKFKQELSLVEKLTEKFAFLSGHMSEVVASGESALWGIWQVESSSGKLVGQRLGKRHFLVISPNNQFLVVKKNELSKLDWDDSNVFVLTKSKLVLENDYLSYAYKIKGKRLTLRNSVKGTRARIKLRRYGDFNLAKP